jgi:RNA polymerase sigma factor (sigma-70 family)
MMSEATWALLRRLLERDYSRYSVKLTRLTGSAELADEALQETYVRLAQGGDIKDHLENPGSYLFKMALNSARVILRKDRQRKRYIDLVDILDIDAVDEDPSPEAVVDGRSDIAIVKAVLATMPERRRAIFLLALLDDMPLTEIARRHGIGVRMVQIELKKAREEIADRFTRLNVVDFASARANALND